MHKLKLTSKISRNEQVNYIEIDDEIVLMNENNDQFYAINTIGSELWSLLENSSLTLCELCERIQENYEISETTCINDVTLFIESLLDKNMLQCTNES